MVIPITLHGPNCTILLLADNLVYTDREDFNQLKLTSNWRDDYKPVIGGEATRRINLAFPDYKQRNYTAHYQDNITTYGADTSSWPQQEQTFKAEYDRGWAYINDIRAASNAWTSMPIDPTADSIWPPTITPIQ